MFRLSVRYLDTAIKLYDDDRLGTSSLWGVRILKSYGILSQGLDHHRLPDRELGFDYSEKQISVARKVRVGYYWRLLKPEYIIESLKYSPITVDVEIFDSIHNDVDGIITLPDRNDKRCDSGHSFLVVGYNKQNNVFDVKASNWPTWGNNGYGKISLEYLKNYFVTAFLYIDFPELGITSRAEKSKHKIQIANKHYNLYIFLESSMFFERRININFEVINKNRNLIAWTHLAFDHKNKELEILEIFVLKEYRHMGIGSIMIDCAFKYTQPVSCFGYVAGQDLVGEGEEIVKSFLLKNDFLFVVDYSHFKDCKFKFFKNNLC